MQQLSQKGRVEVIIGLTALFIVGLVGFLVLGGQSDDSTSKKVANSKVYCSSYGKICFDQPTGWKLQKTGSEITHNAQQPGVTLTKNTTHITWAPDASEPKFNCQEGMTCTVTLISATPLRKLPSLTAVQMVTHFTYAGQSDDFVQAEELVINSKEFATYTLSVDQAVTRPANFPSIYKLYAGDYTTRTGVLRSGMTSGPSLTPETAKAWFATPEAQVAHQTLLSLRLDKP